MPNGHQSTSCWLDVLSHPLATVSRVWLRFRVQKNGQNGEEKLFQDPIGMESVAKVGGKKAAIRVSHVLYKCLQVMFFLWQEIHRRRRKFLYLTGTELLSIVSQGSALF